MLEQFWQYGILAAVLIFGLKIGLALGFSGIKKRNVYLILVGYFVGLVVLSYIVQPYTKELYNFVYNYTSYIFAVIAAVILITGFKTVYDWKVTGKDVGSSTCMAVVAPCPCCFGAILTSILLVSPMAGVSSVSLGLLSSVALVAVMGITYALSTKIVKKINKPYPIVLGNFMIFIGLYFCLCLLILPNISSLTSGSAVQIQSLTDIGYMLIAVIGLVILGIIYTKRKSDLIEF
ncbi:DUF2162 domain-containing protein [Candidatus Methanosphaera massiliense]|jgi:predicted transporter|uniref:DUF2162 domain-containing protein n=1 Tax=Methanosphaera TaxID=2316 RepID=UPI0023801B42|nr:DUF2162 domain-containing protein [Candidatus Methanosphaera massiliense]MDD6285442.1 DUF2162 domain-containing protein [Methanobacteriaceae archaeon]MDE4077496.1 DUF2162 domain-containing protein [Candidatus Methanosphaera massiliense]MDY2744421.1 DUF2162 domain-containing protein [Methanosphaera sp.]